LPSITSCAALNDQRRLFFIEPIELEVRFRRRPFDHGKSTNELSTEPVTANRKIQYRSLGGRAVQGVNGHFHRTHRISLDAT
jgi:hypothetical protein